MINKDSLANWLEKYHVCPITHTAPYGKSSRSRYFWKANLVYVNEKNIGGWNYLSKLAHELGHALDYNNCHPAQKVMGKARKSQNRARQELAAVGFWLAVVEYHGLNKMKMFQNHTTIQVAYYRRYSGSSLDLLEEVKNMCLAAFQE